MPRPDRLWSSLNPLSLLLLPFAAVFALLAAARRALYRTGILRSRRFDVPVLVVGNITVGGTGKTPLVIWLAAHLRQQGWRPGIVSRGYRGRAGHWPQQVRADSDPAAVGDEAVMLAAATGCPMSVGPDRPAAVEALLQHTDVDIVISDDGLQHYAMTRDLEIVVIDGERRLGNGLPLPAGPLREPRSRLESVDMVIANGKSGEGEYAMTLSQPSIRGLHDDRAAAIEDFAGQEVHAVAGIGNPQRFFALLQRAGMQVNPHPFPDHHAFRARDLVFRSDLPVLMTEKDAVKCRRLPCRRCWVVHVDARPDPDFVDRLNTALKEMTDGQKASRHTGLPDL